MAANSVQSLMQQVMSPQNIRQIAAQTGMDEPTARRSVAAALPTLLAGLGINATNPQQAQAILNALDKDHDGNVLEDINAYFATGGDVQQGSKIVGHILGGQEDAVQEQLARSAGVNKGTMGTVLSALAPLVLGALSRDAKENDTGVGGLAGMLLGQDSPMGGLLGALMGGGGSQASSASSGGGMDDLLGTLLDMGMGGGSSQASSASSGGGMGDLLGSLLGGMGGSGGSSSSASSGMGGLLGSLLGGLGGGSSSSSHSSSGGSSSHSSGQQAQDSNDLSNLLGGLLGQ